MLRDRKAKKRWCDEGIIYLQDIIANKGDGKSKELGEVIGDYFNAEEIALSNLDKADIYSKIKDILLKSKHNDLLATWLASDCSMTQCELANKFNISQAHVSRIITWFRRELKSKLDEAC